MNTKCKITCVAVLFTILVVSSAWAQINSVPSLDNLSQSQAKDTLSTSGFKPLLKYCFSDDVKKYYIIPGSQDPEAGTPLNLGEQVTVRSSLGPLPIVIGKSKDEAKSTFEDFNISVDIIQGRNSSFLAGYIYNQIPLIAGCIYPNFKIKLFNNSPLNVVITSPKENESVSNTVIVKANVSPHLLPGEHLWIAVKPYRSITNWWPQSNGPIEPANGYLEGYASLPGDYFGDKFEIAILLLDDELNSIFKYYLYHSAMENSWPPITKGDPVTEKSVSRAVIESRKIASVTVTLNAARSDLSYYE